MGMGTTIREVFSRALTLRSNVNQREGDWEDLRKGCSQQSLEAKLSIVSQGSERCCVGLETVKE